jgi:uncharacterized membrane protein (UPF0127 family)
MLINKKTKKVIAKKVINFKSIHQIGVGLMFRTKAFCKNKAFLFHLNQKKKYCVTMLFVFFELDILFLDEKFRVVKIKKNIKPFVFNYDPKTRFKYMVELLSANRNIKVGDVLEFNEV